MYVFLMFSMSRNQCNILLVTLVVSDVMLSKFFENVSIPSRLIEIDITQVAVKKKKQKTNRYTQGRTQEKNIKCS